MGFWFGFGLGSDVVGCFVCLVRVCGSIDLLCFFIVVCIWLVVFWRFAGWVCLGWFVCCFISWLDEACCLWIAWCGRVDGDL